MKTQLKLVTAAVAAAVSLGMSAPLWAAAHTGAASTDMAADFKAERKRCQEMPKGGERDSCMKSVRANEKSARRSSDAKGTDRSSPKSPGEIAGADKMQKSPTGTEREKSSLPQAPKGANETAGAADKGDAASRRAKGSKGSDTMGSGSGATTSPGTGPGPVGTPKSPNEAAGKGAAK